MKRLWILGTAAVVMAAMIGCGGGGKDPVLAKVGPRSIHASDFQRTFSGMKASDRPDVSTIEARQAFLRDMVNKELLELAATEKYPQLTEQQGWRFKRFRDGETIKILRRRLIQDRIKITKEMKDAIYANRSRERHLLGMVIPDPATAGHVKERLDQGEDFVKLAKDFSATWLQAEAPADLGWAQSGTHFPYEFDLQVWAAPIGSTLGPYVTATGSYIARVLEERPAEVPATREQMDALLEDSLLQILYMDRQKAVIDSLRAYEDPVITDAGRNIIMAKYYWEPPPEQKDNPMAFLDADRVTPSFTAEEESTQVYVFKHAPAWNMKEFASRLEWVPAGLWPKGQTEAEVDELFSMMGRDYLLLKAAEDLGYAKDPELVKLLDTREREMKVTYFYYNDVMKGVTPSAEDLEAWFNEHRDRYKLPPSYKVSFFSSRDKNMMSELAADWRAGMSYGDLEKKYTARDPNLEAVGESRWLYKGNDPLVDEVVGALKEGEVSDPVTRTDYTVVLKLVGNQGERIPSYAEVKEQADADGKADIADTVLKNFLAGEEKKRGVKIYEKRLAGMTVDASAVGETAGPENPPPAGLPQ